MRDRSLGLGILPYPTPRFNCMAIRFQGQVQDKQPPHHSVDTVGVCPRAMWEGRSTCSTVQGGVCGLVL